MQGREHGSLGWGHRQRRGRRKSVNIESISFTRCEDGEVAEDPFEIFELGLKKINSVLELLI